MINRASVELIQKLMSSRFEHMMCYSKYAMLQRKKNIRIRRRLCIYITVDNLGCKITCNFHIPFLRQDDSEGDQLLDTQNVISRFRANLVIAGEEPFEEDNWPHLIIGNTRFVVSWDAWWKIFRCIKSGSLKNERPLCVINQKRSQVSVDGARWLE